MIWFETSATLIFNLADVFEVKLENYVRLLGLSAANDIVGN